MQRRHPLIGDVRCPGLMVAIELVRDRETKAPAPAAAREIARRSATRGVLFGESRYAGLGDIIKVKPPLDIRTSNSIRHSTCSTKSSPNSRPTASGDSARPQADRLGLAAGQRPSSVVRIEERKVKSPHQITLAGDQQNTKPAPRANLDHRA
jgi:hypothetical protein